jgi:hypothetical protein
MIRKLSRLEIMEELKELRKEVELLKKKMDILLKAIK